MTLDISSAIISLNATRSPVANLVFPSEPGVYAVYLTERSSLRPYANAGDILYVGKSESSLKARDLRTHFASGKTGRSTLRRTLGAILKDELRLKCIPRKVDRPSPKDYECYRFQDEGEARLTAWMYGNLDAAYLLASPYGIPVGLLERLIKEALKPPLNLDSSYAKTNPFAVRLLALRKACADEARRAT